MNTSEVNRKVDKLYKQYIASSKLEDIGQCFEAQEIIKEQLRLIVEEPQAIAKLLKINILKLIKLQSSLRYMAHHTFYIQFALACEQEVNEYLNNL